MMLYGSLLRVLAVGMLAQVALAGSARAQQVVPSASILAGRHGIGAEIEASFGRLGVFGRSEGFPFSNTKAVTAGFRVWPFVSNQHGVFLSPGATMVTCAETDFSGGATGCDGESEWALSLVGGLQLVTHGRRFGLFVDGGYLRPFEASPDVPNWTFAAGVRWYLR